MALQIASPFLTPADQDALAELFRRGTAENTLRAYEQDLRYIMAWKAAAFGTGLEWLPDNSALLVRMIPAGRGAAPTEAQTPTGPIVQVNEGRLRHRPQLARG